MLNNGQAVVLRDIANVSKGGTYRDVTSKVHPDNREMAEALARAFRMDSFGVDFITTDISKSWRDNLGAIIEVNHTPGAGTPFYTRLLLENLFPAGQRTRLMSALFLNESSQFESAKLIRRLERRNVSYALIESHSTKIGAFSRGGPSDSLNMRVQSVLLDPTVKAIIVKITDTDIRAEGLLLENIDYAFLGASTDKDVEKLVSRFAKVVRYPGNGNPRVLSEGCRNAAF